MVLIPLIPDREISSAGELLFIIDQTRKVFQVFLIPLCPAITMSTIPTAVSTTPNPRTDNSCCARRKIQNTIPARGINGIFPTEIGIRKGREDSGDEYRRKMTAALITMNVTKSMKLVTFAIKVISPVKRRAIERMPQNNIAVQGVRLPG